MELMFPCMILPPIYSRVRVIIKLGLIPGSQMEQGGSAGWYIIPAVYERGGILSQVHYPMYIIPGI